MTKQLHETAPTQFVQVGDNQVAYRRFGKRGAPTLLLLNYFAANMDDWDPKITNGLAAERDVIIFDYPGVGRSTGVSRSTVAAMTKDFVGFCEALDLNRFDIVGFSLGGHADQRLSPGGASAQRSTDSVSGRQPRSAVATRGRFLGARPVISGRVSIPQFRARV